MAGSCVTLFNIAFIRWHNGEQDAAKREPINLADALQALENLAGNIGLEGGLQGWEMLAQQMGVSEADA
ncbi:MAG: hypothetical protein ACK4RS_03620 [Thiothrix sp.]